MNVSTTSNQIQRKIKQKDSEATRGTEDKGTSIKLCKDDLVTQVLLKKRDAKCEKNIFAVSRNPNSDR